MILLWIALIVGVMAIYCTIGQVAAIKLSPRVAELCVEQKYEVTQYEWRDNNQETKFVDVGWQPRVSKEESETDPDYLWKKTGKTKGEYTAEFSEQDYRNRMFYIRTWWIFYLPYLMNYMVDTKQIEDYDPERGKIREAILKQKIAELEEENQRYIETGELK